MPEHGGNIREIISKYSLSFEEIIDFSANINPLAPPDYIKNVILEEIKFVAHYPDEDARGLQAALSQYLLIDKERIIPSNGSVELIYLLAQLMPLRRALILAPAFSEYSRAFPGRYRLLSRREEENFHLPMSELIEAIPGANIVFLGNPNNPTGDLTSRENVLTIVESARDKGGIVVVDEVFMDFLCPEESVVRETEQYKNLFVLRSLTKFFGLPGLRIGYCVAHPYLIKDLKSHQPPWTVNSLAQAVGVAVLRDKAFIQASKDFISQEREFLFEELTRIPGLKPYPSKANFILIKLLNHTSSWLSDELSKEGLLVRDCSNFDLLEHQFIRVAVRKRSENLRLLEALEKSLDKAR